MIPTIRAMLIHWWYWRPAVSRFPRLRALGVERARRVFWVTLPVEVVVSGTLEYVQELKMLDWWSRAAFVALQVAHGTVRTDAALPLGMSAAVERQGFLPLGMSAEVERQGFLPLGMSAAVERQATLPLDRMVLVHPDELAALFS